MPTTDAEWQEQFELYKQFPEFKYNSGISMQQFKSIWLMEYAHRCDRSRPRGRISRILTRPPPTPRPPRQRPTEGLAAR